MGQPHILFRIFPYVGLTLLSAGAYYLIRNNIFFDFFFAVFGLQSAVFILNALWWSGLPGWILLLGELMGLAIVFHLLGPWVAAVMVTLGFWLWDVGGQRKAKVAASGQRTNGTNLDAARFKGAEDGSESEVEQEQAAADAKSKQQNGRIASA